MVHLLTCAITNCTADCPLNAARVAQGERILQRIAAHCRVETKSQIETSLGGVRDQLLLQRIEAANTRTNTMSADPEAASATTDTEGIIGFHGVRYIVTNVERAVEFYVTKLGFELEHQQLPAFASVSRGDLKILLSGPGASGSRPLPNGEPQIAGGSNRVVLRVNQLPTIIEALRRQQVRFRNSVEVGPGGRQIQVEDPDGNSIELFEPAPRP